MFIALYPLLSAFFSAASYILTKFFIVGNYIPNTKIVTVMFHTNIINLTIFFVYYFYKKIKDEPLFSFKEKFINIKSLWQLILLGLPVMSAIVKSEITEYLPISTIEISALIKPFIICLLAVLLLKEKFRVKYVICFLGAICGLYLANTKKMTVTMNDLNMLYNSKNTCMLLFYILISSIGNITRRYYCIKRKNTMETICAEYMVFFIYGTTILIFQNSLDLKLLFNKYVLCVSLLTLLHHYCLIHGVQKVKEIAGLELLAFTKTVFAISLSFLILHEEVSKEKILGALIITVAVMLSGIKKKNPKEDAQQK